MAAHLMRPQNKIGAGDGRVALAVKSKVPLDEAVTEFYLRAFGRKPRADELQTAR